MCPQQKIIMFCKGSTELRRCKNYVFFLPVNILTKLHTGFLAARHTTLYLDYNSINEKEVILLVFKLCEHLHKCHSNLILNKAKCIDSLIAINSLSLVAFPVYGNAMNKGKEAKLKLFIAISIRESVHLALLRIKFEWDL